LFVLKILYTNRNPLWVPNKLSHYFQLTNVVIVPRSILISSDHAGKSGTGSDVEIGHGQGVLLDEVTPRFDVITHECREDIVRRHGIFDPDLHQAP